MPENIEPAAAGHANRPLLRVTPADVGRRVSLRRALGEADGRPRYGDVVGELLSWADGVVVVRRRSSETVEMSEASLVAGRVVPPAVAPAALTVAELEEIAARGWPAPDEAWLGRWWLRAADGFTGRANSVVPLGDPGMPVDDALAHVQAWYGARRLPPWFMVEPEAPLDEELAERGWRRTHGGAVLVQTAAIDRVLKRLAAAGLPAGYPARLGPVPPAGWLWLYKGAGELPPVAGHVLGAHPRVAFATIGEPVIAGGRVTVDGPWAGVAGMEVAPERRGRGFGRATLHALLGWAKEQAASEAYLQVAEDNVAAVRLYGALGFTTHHRYHYRGPTAG